MQKACQQENISFVIAGIGMIGRVFANSYMPFFLCMALTGFSNMFVNITEMLIDFIAKNSFGYF